MPTNIYIYIYSFKTKVKKLLKKNHEIKPGFKFRNQELNL